MLQTYKILFDIDGNPKQKEVIQNKLSNFSDSYCNVTRSIIEGSLNLDEKSFRKNIADLMPAFKMTRRGVFHGLNQSSPVLDYCWKEFGKELQDLREKINGHSSVRGRALLDVPEDILEVTSDIFDRLEWTEIDGSDIKRVGASKILFAIFPEIALPVDNSEWDTVFRTHYYGKILKLMKEEIRSWEDKSNIRLETLDRNSPTTLVSVYNVMAMEARLPKKKNCRQ